MRGNGDDNYYLQATDQERKEMRDWFKGLLNTERVTVTFVKADGTERTMVCTLAEAHGAVYTVNEGREPREPRPDVCVVWDCEKSSWRSFRYDRLKRIEFSLG